MNAPPRKRHFGLRFLLILIAVICVVLSLFYPRVYCSAVLDLGTSQIAPPNSSGAANSYQLVAESPFMRQRLAESDPEAAAMLAKDPGWLSSHLTVADVGNNRLEFRIVGRPTEKAKLRKLVDAITGVLVAHSTDQANEMRAKTKEIFTKAKSDLTKKLEAMPSSAERERLVELQKEIDKNVAQLEKEIAETRLPQVVERTSGVEF